MLNPRWIKLLRDLDVAKGRMLMMALVIAAGVFAVTTLLGAYTILTREMSRNYLATNPASASLELDNLDQSLLEKIRLQKGIAAAEARATVRAQIQVDQNHWLPVTLFVIADFTEMHLSTFSSVSGAWPHLMARC